MPAMLMFCSIFPSLLTPHRGGCVAHMVAVRKPRSPRLLPTSVCPRALPALRVSTSSLVGELTCCTCTCCMCNVGLPSWGHSSP